MNTNLAVISGNLTRDPEMRVTQTGKNVTKFTVAVNRGGGKNGEKSEADFIPVVVWDKQAESCAKYLAKGRQVVVTGKISVRRYEAQDGTTRYATEIVAHRVEFVGGAKTADAGNAREPGIDDDMPYAISDDDIPF